MQFVSPRHSFYTPALDEFLQNTEFVCASRLDSARVVKNVATMIGEHKFVLDGVLASLTPSLETTEEKYHQLNTNIHGRLKLNLSSTSDIKRTEKKASTTYLLPLLVSPPVNNGTLRCVTDSL